MYKDQDPNLDPNPNPRENFLALYTSTRTEMDKIMQRIIQIENILYTNVNLEVEMDKIMQQIIQIENILYTNVNLEVDLDIATDTYRPGVTEGEPPRKRCKM